MNEKITPVVMPKWGLSMKEGTLTEWHVQEGDTIEAGQIIMDVETDKIASEVEAPDAGLLRRRVGQEGDIYGVQALLGVLAPADVPEQEIDNFIAGYHQPEVEEDNGSEAQTAYRFLETGSGKIRYSYLDGDGTPYVLVHGFGGDLDNWLFTIDALAGKGPVLALDLPGHGQSVSGVADMDLPHLCQAVCEVMDGLDIKQAHLVGHSMGGLVCSQIALSDPDKVKSLVLIASAGLGPDINADYLRGFIDAQSRRELKPVLQQLFADPALVTRNLTDEVLKYKRLDGVGEQLGALMKALFHGGQQQEQLSGQINQAGVPVLAVWGEQDRVIPCSHAKSLARADVHVLPGAGHMVQMEAAAEVNAIILAHKP